MLICQAGDDLKLYRDHFMVSELLRFLLTICEE